MTRLFITLALVCLIGCGGVYHNPDRTRAQTQQDFWNANLEAEKYSAGDPFQRQAVQDAYLKAHGYEAISQKEAKKRGWTLKKY